MRDEGTRRSGAAVVSTLALVVFALSVGVAQETGTKVTERLSDLVSELGHPDETNRRLAAYELEHFDYTTPGITNLDEVVGALAKALGDRDEQVWAHSVRALARIGPPAADAVPALMEGLSGRDQQAYRSAYALGRIGAAAVGPLRDALRRDSGRRRIAAARALTWSGPAAAPAIPFLIEAMADASDDAEVLRSLASDALAGIGPQAIQPLLTALESTPASVRAGAARALGNMGTVASSCVDRLAEAIDDPEPDVRARVVIALGKVGTKPERLVPILARRLEDADATVREAALNSLVKLRAAEDGVLEVLVSALESRNRRTVYAAAVGLRRFGPDAVAAVPQLVNALLESGQEEEEIVTALAEALGKTGPEATPRLIEAFDDERAVGTRFVGVTKALATIGSSGVPPLLKALDDASDRVRLGAIEALGAIGASGRLGASEPEVVNTMSRALEDADAEVSCRAAAALGRLGPAARGSVARLVNAAREGDLEVRSASIRALSEIGVDSETFVPLLVAALESGSADLRRPAVSAVARLGAEAAAAAPGLIASTRDDDPAVRAGAAEALGQIGASSGEATAALVRLTEDRDANVRLAAVRACGQLGPAAQAAVPALVRAAGTDAVSALAAAPETEEVRLAAVAALGSVGPAASGAGDVLKTALQRGGTKLRAEAATSLGKIGARSDELVPVMVAALRKEEEPEVRRAIVDVLGDIGPAAQDAVPALFEMMDRRYESRVAYEAIRKIGPTSVPLLREALQHSSGFVKMLAAESLQRLGAKAKDAIPDLREALNAPRRFGRLESTLREALESIVAAVEKEEKEKPRPKLRVF